MASWGLVLVVAIVCALYGSWVEQLACVLLYALVIGYRRPLLLLCLIAGFLLGYGKAYFSKPHHYQKGYIETTLTLSSHPILTPENTYRLQSDIIVFFSSQPWFLGDTVEVYGFLRPKGNIWILTPQHINLKKRNILATFSKLYLFWQKRLLDHIPPSNIRDLCFALMLGNRYHLDYTTRREFQITGIFHLLALSGLHLALLTSGIVVVLQVFFARRLSLFIACAFASLYTILVGAPGSLVRACLFLWGYVFLYATAPRASWIHWIAFSASLLCVLFPPGWLSIGLGLSFLAITGIYLLGKPFALIFQKFRPFDTLLATTLAANIVTLPLLSMSFGEVSLISPLANLVVVPVFPFLLGGCFMTACWALFHPVPSFLVEMLQQFWSFISFPIHLFSLIDPLFLRFSPIVVRWVYFILGAFLLARLLQVYPASSYLPKKT